MKISVFLTLFLLLMGVNQAISQINTTCDGITPRITASTCSAVCAGSSVTLDAGDNFVAYEWSNGASTRTIILTTPEESGNVTCIVQTMSGCRAISAPVPVNIYPSADKPYIVQQGNVLSATEAATYRWLFNGKIQNTLSERTIEAKQTGDYRVVVTDAHGCSATSDVVTVSTLSANTPERGHDARLRVYPNPSDGRITIQLLSDFEGSIDLHVHDLSGREVFGGLWVEPHPFDVYAIDLTAFTDGTYILTAHDGVDMVVHTIIKQK